MQQSLFMQAAFGRHNAVVGQSKTIFNRFLSQTLSFKTYTCFGGHSTSFTQAFFKSKAQQATAGLLPQRLDGTHSAIGILLFFFSYIWSDESRNAAPAASRRALAATV